MTWPDPSGSAVSTVVLLVGGKKITISWRIRNRKQYDERGGGEEKRKNGKETSKEKRKKIKLYNEDIGKFVCFLRYLVLYIYVGKESTHTPGTLRAIPSGVLNRLEKLTSRKPSLHSEGVDKVYPDHANALRKAVLAPPDFPTMGDLWKMQDEKLEIENEKRN